MLKELIVKHLAIIEDISISFEKGFNAITGQTGAGKSLLIDSISLILGARADQDLIRYGKESSTVIAKISDLNPEALNFLAELGINPADNEIEIYRKMNINGKNQIKVCDQAITLTDLKKLGLLIGDIHVQHDTYRLINKDNYLSFLDDLSDSKFQQLLSKYQIARMSYFDQLDKYHSTLKRRNELKEKIDVLEFQRQELSVLGLEEDIDLKLEEEINKLSNFDKIYTNINESYQIFDTTFDLDQLYQIKANLETIEKYDSQYQELKNTVTDAFYNLEEVKSSLYEIKENLDYDPNHLDELNSRLYEIEKIKTKYHMSVKELMEYLEKISLDIKLETDFDSAILELKNAVVKKHQALVDSSLELSSYRKKKALKVSEKIIKESREMDLENTNFEIKFEEINLSDPFDKTPFKDYGIDDIDFYVTFNKGEPLKPLSKVASGGELSRLMLAFKIIYLENNPLSFMVFDEIDAGISGTTARKIGLKLKNIAKNVQVFAITHLANVASLAQNHLYIEKNIVSGRTITSIKKLDDISRIREIASMLSGLEVSQEFLETAKKMIEQN